MFIFGGAAEGRLTVLSDIDVLVVTNRSLTDSERRKVKAKMLKVAEGRGLPWYYPVDIHVVNENEFKEYGGRAKILKRLTA